MSKQIAILATLDTKGEETDFLREQIRAAGDVAVVVDIGVIGNPATTADVTRQQVAAAGGVALAELLENPTRQTASPVMNRGAVQVLQERLVQGKLDAVLGLGGTQGTSNCTAIMRELPYGLPKIMLSTMASGDTSSFVDIKDITMMFSVSDILGLNPLTRRMLANAAGAACGMAKVNLPVQPRNNEKPLIGMTNLGVLTEGAMTALQEFSDRGYEVIVFHAVGSGGRAMEQMMKEGIIGAVFDYALGEISDELFDGFRAASAERLTVAGKLGLPQVLCPGGTEHIGLMTEPNVVPDAYRNHTYTFHNPVIFVPRLNAQQMTQLAQEIGQRLTHSKGRACFMIPEAGTSRYGVAGAVLHDPDTDAAFVEALTQSLPASISVIKRPTHAEDPEFVREAVQRLIALIEAD